jgi:hypothetical protein
MTRPISVAGDTPEDQQLWHTYFFWPRAILSPSATRKLRTNGVFKRLPRSRSSHLQAIVFAAFALEYRLKRIYEVLGLSYRDKDTLGALLANFRRRVETAARLDGRGPVRLPAEWASVESRLKRLNTIRNHIAHANYRKLLALVPSDTRASRAIARQCVNALVDAIRVTNRALGGYDRLTPSEARRYYSRLRIR